MLLRIHGSELMRFAQDPLPWWDDTVRSELGRVISGQPATETDDDNNPTGWYLMAHPDIDVRDVWLLDVVRAGWRYADSRDDGQALIEYQAARDWQGWQTLHDLLARGAISPHDVQERAFAAAVAQAAKLGVEPPKSEEPLDVLVNGGMADMVRDLPGSGSDRPS